MCFQPRLLSRSAIASKPGGNGAPRTLLALGCLALSAAPASALVGGAPLAEQVLARHVALVMGGQSLCTGVAVAPDLAFPSLAAFADAVDAAFAAAR